MTEEQITNMVVAAITAVTTVASQYGLKKLGYKKGNLELQQQQDHNDSLYSKVIQLQKDSVAYLDEANKQILKLKEENAKLKEELSKLK